MMDKPNVLFLLSDDQSYFAQHRECPEILTPNLDALAREGVRFSNCSTVAPLCVPARILIAKPRPSDDPTLQSTAAK